MIPCYHGSCLSTLATGSFHNRALNKYLITLTTTLMDRHAYRIETGIEGILVSK